MEGSCFQIVVCRLRQASKSSSAAMSASSVHELGNGLGRSFGELLQQVHCPVAGLPGLFRPSEAVVHAPAAVICIRQHCCHPKLCVTIFEQLTELPMHA